MMSIDAVHGDTLRRDLPAFRAGDTVRLKDLLDEAVERAQADLRRRLEEEERQESSL